MALADPVTLKKSGTVAWTGQSDMVFTKLEPGKYVLSTSTADEPTYLTIKANLRNNGKQSDYLIRLDQFQNIINPVNSTTPDASLSCYAVIRCDYGQFSTTSAKMLVSQLGSILVGAGLTGITLDQILRGER